MASLFLAGTLLAIAVIDLRTYRIPDALSLPLLCVGLLLAWFEPEARPWDHALGAVLGYGSLALFGEIYFRLRHREGLGLGDAKLFGAAGAWLGWQALPLVLAIASAGALVFALVTLRWRRDPRLAFGPWLAFGFWIGWITGW